MFITYQEYKSMGGALDETAFNIYAYAACSKIKTATYGRATAANEAVKRCAVRLCDILHKSDVTKNTASSFSHDGYSQSFAAVSAEQYRAAADDIIFEYLSCETTNDGTPLLYRGVDND